MDFTDLRKHWSDSDKKEIPERESMAHPNMAKIARLTTEMRNDGWRDSMYCPKGGEVFWAWEPTMGLPYRCIYQGEWPNGTYWAMVHGDMWSCHPVLFKAIADEKQA